MNLYVMRETCVRVRMDLHAGEVECVSPSGFLAWEIMTQNGVNREILTHRREDYCVFNYLLGLCTQMKYDI